MTTCFTILKMISRLNSLLTMILALVVGFMYFSCNKEMSTWLLVTGFTIPITFILLLTIICLTLPSIGRAIEDESGEILIISLLPTIIICTLTVGFSIIILSIAWIIYGAILFFPVASGPYPICSDGKDGKILVITGLIIVLLKMVFVFFPPLPATYYFNKIWMEQTETTITTWRTTRLNTNTIEMEGTANYDLEDDVRHEAVRGNKLVTGLHALSLWLMFQ